MFNCWSGPQILSNCVCVYACYFCETMFHMRGSKNFRQGGGGGGPGQSDKKALTVSFFFFFF